MSERILKLMLASAMVAGAAGCRHKAQPLVIPAPTPVAVSNPPVPNNPAQIPTETAGQTPLPTVAVVPATPAKKVKRKVVPAPAAAPAPVEMASVAPPPMEIGSLSTGGGDAAGNRKAAEDLLAANERRLAGLSAKVKEKQKDQVTRVMTFQEDARKAFSSGDVGGALTLATKAKVLLDEMK